jgi:hypothetical protein
MDFAQRYSNFGNPDRFKTQSGIEQVKICLPLRRSKSKVNETFFFPDQFPFGIVSLQGSL